MTTSEGYNKEYIWEEVEEGVSRVSLRQTKLIAVEVGLDHPVCVERTEELLLFLGKDAIGL